MASILSLKLVLISVTVVLTVLGLKASLLPFATTHLPLIWNLLLLCFKPPYLYLILNAIIISILATSRFHHHSPPPDPTPSPLPSPPDHQFPQNDIADPTPPTVLEVNGSAAVDEEEEDVKEIDDGGMNSIELKWINSTAPMEKPHVSTRLDHRKPLKSSPEGGRVAKGNQHETLENTWKAITEGGSCRQMKKRDPWGPLEVKKSATFKGHRTHQPPVLSKLRKEPSLSQDELNRRVEAFIRNFNQQMKLQRQESLNQNLQMIDRGAN